MSDNDLSPDDGWSIVEGTWESVLQTEAVPGDPDVVLHDPLTASVAVAGDPTRLVTFTCGRVAGEAVARAMLDLPDDEQVTDEDVEDAAGEVVNILGGNVKSVLDGATRLGLPNVVAGGVAQTGDALWQTSVQWAGHVAQVALWRQDTFENDDAERMAAR
ncbi:MAG TPA: chemotaxis protein CheX [Actinomycetales bacterium]|jgi:chemotaxis protein CheX